MNTCSLSFPAHVDLARLPTPVQPMRRAGQKLGIDLYVKRDDMTGVALSGNKIRKLEFVLADALTQQADTIITCGGAQSNHCRATAIASAMLGLSCRLLLRTPDPTRPPSADGNILLDRLAGAEIVWITPEDYKHRDEFMEQEGTSLAAEGRKPYLIPEGASNALGAWGYIRAAEELVNDIANLPGGLNRATTIINAAGSGGTSAGLILGAKMLDLNVRIVSVNVSDDRDYFIKAIGNICERAIADYQMKVDFSRDRDIEILDGYVGRGYGKAQPAELEFLYETARTEGIFFDPVYTGKAFWGMAQELKKDSACFGERVIFIHTGGIFGIFPLAEQIQPLF